MNKAIIVLGILVVLGGGVVWYMSSNGTNDNANQNTNAAAATNTNTTNTTQTSPVNTNGNQDVADYAISMTNYRFSPSSITAEPGQTLRITLTNNGSTEHDFIIDELNVDSGLIAPGTSKTITVTAGDTAATYEFRCGVSDHEDRGMVGTFRQ